VRNPGSYPGRGLGRPVWEGSARNQDPGCLFDGEGRTVSRHILVRKSSLVGLGKEGTKLAARLKVGKTAAADPAVFIDWKRRLLAMGRAEARRLGLPWATVKRWKKRLRYGLPLENGHGGRALARLKTALLAGGT
jgi:hypothetical protein